MRSIPLACCLILTALYHPLSAQEPATATSPVAMSVARHGLLASAPERDGIIWPRGGILTYLQGAGLWIGATVTTENGVDHPVAMTYNPMSGRSWMLPGRMTDTALSDAERLQRFPTLRMDDNDPSGMALRAAVLPPGQPLHADEHHVSVYTAGSIRLREPSSWHFQTNLTPLPLDVTQHTFTWNDGPLKDAVLIVYEIVNPTSSPVGPCHAGLMCDPDIGRTGSRIYGAENDHSRTMTTAGDIPVALSWSGVDRGEYGIPMGYVATGLIETPSGRNGPRSVQIFTSTSAIHTNAQRWDMLSAKGTTLQDAGPADVRTLTSTGPFTVAPGQRIRIAATIVFAMPVLAPVPNGMDADAAAVRKTVEALADVYYGADVTSVTAGTMSADAPGDLAAWRVGNAIHVDLPSGVDDDGEVGLIGVDGRTILSQRVEAGASTTSLDAGSLLSGTYVVRYVSGKTVRARSIAFVR